MGAAAFMDRKEPLAEPSARGSFLNALSRQLQPAEKHVPKTTTAPHTQQPEERSLSDAMTSNTDVIVIQPLILPLILVSPREAEREYNSLKLPNELTCEPYDCSRRYASAQMGPESPGTDADTSSLGKSAKRERSVPIGRRSQ
ncbi:hypothetical protein DPX16_19036 [Anabarilius grahami]|uniref:Uncharacterized protein n=1 Tax=Anabarilius grahami TaxID=495550 RepID=A0A3N0YVK8_ANAGA|nr:hypothetical protein DPX16_19036 [Anabarilius grahami]